MDKRSVSFILAMVMSMALWAQSPSRRNSVMVEAAVSTSPPSITLSWESFSGTNGFTIYRRNTGSTSWGGIHASVAGSASSYTDNAVTTGVGYEYKVVRNASSGTGYGYIATGIQLPAIEERGIIVLLVANNISSSLATEIGQLELDLRADGWVVKRHDVSTSASVTSVRGIVVSEYNAAPSDVKAVYVLGHVPVPYSGNHAPDGHSEHVGAWPCDGYYGEVNGNWTDASVNNSNAQRPQNDNVPGDGKFDHSNFPSPVELQVGRVDLQDMPAFSAGEVQLLQNYLNKAHQYKRKQWVPQERGLVLDNLQWVGNPIAGCAYRNMGPLVGHSNVTDCYPYGSPFSSYVNGQSYMWTYSSGGGLQATDNGVLTFNGADNIATTQNYATTLSMGGVFNMSCGSYFGDWDNRNNFLRAPLGSGQALTSVWAGMPNWWFHHMGVGETIGHGVLLSMNNTTDYQPQNGGWQGSPYNRAHLGLMGDPTLRMHMVAPPAALQVTNNGGTAAFSWNASPDNVAGYYLYQFDQNTGEISRVVPAMITGTSHQSPTVPFVAGKEYMVRAVKLQTSKSGTYYNLSLGAIATAAGTPVPDCQGTPGGSALPGTACNDGNSNTGNDTWDANCNCVGQLVDCQGTPGGSALPGTACNDGNANTGNDTWDANCNCVGQLVDCQGTPGGSALPGTACNDGNANTGNDTWDANCNCVGQLVDCQGTPGGSALPGTACNDGNANTGNDTWDANCNCVGQLVDCQGTPGGSALPGTACNDGNANTGNDTWDANCNCVGQLVDCQGTPGGSALPGTACNDGNANTGNDTWDANCNCVGQLIDCQGTPGGSALPGTACNDGNANTGNDAWDANCNCVGQPIDCRVPGGLLPVRPATTAIRTRATTWDANCNCVGQLIDCEGTPGGSALPGTSCNDGDANTINDQWTANCQCVGTAVTFDCEGVANGPALPGTACNDGDPNTGNDSGTRTATAWVS
ncbi:MAG: hypothetical protein H6593_09800 [Flavobacteriales bacterium]|nr:hypothetical protein [Flavobacteriales bacterium]